MIFCALLKIIFKIIRAGVYRYSCRFHHEFLFYKLQFSSLIKYFSRLRHKLPIKSSFGGALINKANLFGLVFLLSLIAILGIKSVSVSFYGAIDDEVLIEPFKKIQDLSDYGRAILNEELLDIQPIRDLTFLLGVYLEQKSGFPFQTALNWFIYIILIYGIWTWLGKLNINERIFFWLIIAFHPILLMMTHWIAGRKHLLGFTFLVWHFVFWSRYLESDKKKNFGFSIILSLFSLLSQPIFAFPLLLNSFKYRTQKAAQINILLTVSTVLLNIYYYFVIYGKRSGFGKLNFHTETPIFDRIQVFGRFIFQLFIPILPSSTPYYVGSIQSYFGILLLIYLFLNRKKFPIQLDHLMMIFVLPLIFTILLTDTVGMDSYLLTSILAVPYFIKTHVNFRLSQRVILLLVFVYSLGNIANSYAFHNKVQYFKYSYLTDPWDITAVRLARLNYQSGNYGEAGKYLEDQWKRFQVEREHDRESDREEVTENRKGRDFSQQPSNKTTQKSYLNLSFLFVLGEYIRKSPITVAQKESLFEQYHNSYPTFVLQYAIFKLETSRTQEGIDLILSLSSKNSKLLLDSISMFSRSEFKSIWINSCQKMKDQGNLIPGCMTLLEKL